MIRVGVIGYGYWGPNLVRNFMDVPGSTVAAIADLRSERGGCARARYPGIQITADVGEMLTRPDIDAVAIATPVASHYDLAMQALRAGKHVLVEKPMTATADEACRLIDEAARRGRGDVVTPITVADRNHVFHLYVIRTACRDSLKAHLAERGITTMVHYPKALPFYPAYDSLKHRYDEFPVAHANQGRILSLPLYPEMPDRLIDAVSTEVAGFFENRNE